MQISNAISKKLNIQTPWGLVRPIFVPKGVGPASGILQKCVMDIFSDYGSWTIAILDNLLILAHSYEDAHNKFKIIIKGNIPLHLLKDTTLVHKEKDNRHSKMGKE